MNADLPPANAAARALLKKLRALAERGIDGERSAAQRKLAKLLQRFDFSGPEPAEPADLFHGSFRPAAKARWVYTFGRDEPDVANAVKWALEAATTIPCRHRNGDLLAEATATTARRLTAIAEQIAQSFRALLGRFDAVNGMTLDDRCAFVMGLYDGMMGQARDAGQRLPRLVGRAKKPKGRRNAVNPASAVHLHPYTVALGLGRQIRFSAPLEQLTAELEAATRTLLAPAGPG